MASFTSPLDDLANHDCELCPLHETTERVCVMGRGDPESRVMILGEAPGQAEAETGKVFSGRAGQLLDLHLKESGLSELRPYISNVVKCRPPDNRAPDRVEWETCRVYLEREFRRVRPTHLLLLGNTALRAVARKSGITKHRGVRLDVRDPTLAKTAVMATIHSAYVLRNPGQGSVFAEDIRRFARMVRGEFQVVPVRKTFVRTTTGLRYLKEVLMEAEVIAYDVENIYSPWHDDWRIVMLGVSVDGGQAFVVPLYHPDSPFRKNWKKVLRYLKPAFERSGVKLVAQNGKHDNLQLAGAKVFIRHSFDIMLAAHLLDENRPKNLGFLSQSLLGADVYKGMVETKPDKILNQDLRQLAIYNGNDAGYTHQIYPKLRGELIEQPRLTRLFSKLLMPASHVIQEVEYRGMYVDQDRLWDRIEELEGRISEKVEVLREHNPRYKKLGRDGDFNYNSTQQLGRWLFASERRGGLGLSPLEVTKSGNPSTREAVLLHYREHPAVAALLEYRTLQLKWMNTYLLPWSGKIDRRSRLHTVYKIYGTATGRLSGDLQQVPRDPFIRSVIGAPPGWQFVVADFSQIELRIAAHCAQERRMQRAFLTGEDLHLATASDLTGKSQDQLRKEIAAGMFAAKEERKLSKAVNFGFLYGMWPRKFQAYAFENFGLKVSLAEAEVFRDKYFKMFPDLEKWHRRQERIVRAQHQVQSPIGRIRHLPDVLSSDRGVQQEAIRQAINSPVQSMASDMMLFGMVKLNNILEPNEAFMVGTLHDGIFFEIKEDRVDHWAPIIKDHLENLPLKKTFGTELTVPIEADVEWGQHWGEPVASL